jgi:thioredoxin 1
MHCRLYSFGRLAILLLLATSIVASNQSVAAAADIDNSLQTAKRDGKYVMLELGSVGCIPCEAMRPVMAKLSSTYKGKLEVIFVDVRKDNATARRYRVFGIPTQVFLDKGGKEFHRHVGFYSYDEIVPVLKKAGI